MASDRFAGVAREIAAGTSRRRALRLLVGTLLGGFLELGAVGRVEADVDCRPAGKTCRGRGVPCCSGVCCGEVCCAQGEVCHAGTCVAPPPPPPPMPKPNRVICICGDGTLLNICADIDCLSGPAQDSICGPAWAEHLGESATGCIADDPACA